MTLKDVVALEGVGAKMASKVMEVVETGRLRKVEEICNTEESRVVNMFSNVWGAGPATANAWYTKVQLTPSPSRTFGQTKKWPDHPKIQGKGVWGSSKADVV